MGLVGLTALPRLIAVDQTCNLCCCIATGSTTSHNSSRHDGSEASVQKSRKQLMMEKLKEQLIRGKAIVVKRYGGLRSVLECRYPCKQQDKKTFLQCSVQRKCRWQYLFVNDAYMNFCGL